MSALAKLASIASMCAGVTACAALVPAVVIPQLAVTAGVAGLSGIACAGESSCEAPAAQCTDAAGRKIEATEAAGITIPADEGSAVAFAPAYWQPQFVAGAASKAGAAADASAGTFVVTDKSALFVAPAGVDGVRIPLAGVLDVRTQASATTGAPRQLTLESCFGRLDRITFGQKFEPGRLDSEATAAAAAEIRARLAARRGGAKQGSAGAP